MRRVTYFTLKHHQNHHQKILISESTLLASLEIFNKCIKDLSSAVNYFADLGSFAQKWQTEMCTQFPEGGQEALQAIIDKTVAIWNGAIAKHVNLRTSNQHMGHLMWAFGYLKVPFSSFSPKAQALFLDKLQNARNAANSYSTTARVLEAIGRMIEASPRGIASLNPDIISKLHETVKQAACYVLANQNPSEVVKVLFALKQINVLWDSSQLATEDSWECIFIRAIPEFLHHSKLSQWDEHSNRREHTHYDDHPLCIIHRLLLAMGKVGCRWQELPKKIQGLLFQTWCEAIEEKGSFRYSANPEDDIHSFLKRHQFRLFYQSLTGLAYMKLQLSSMSESPGMRNPQYYLLRAMDKALEGIQYKLDVEQDSTSLVRQQFPYFFAKWAFVAGAVGWSNVKKAQKDKIRPLLLKSIYASDNNLQELVFIFDGFVDVGCPKDLFIDKYMTAFLAQLQQVKFNELSPAKQSRFAEHVVYAALVRFADINNHLNIALRVTISDTELATLFDEMLAFIADNARLVAQIGHSALKYFRGDTPLLCKVVSKHVGNAHTLPLSSDGSIAATLHHWAVVAKTQAFAKADSAKILKILEEGLLLYTNEESTAANNHLFSRFLGEIFTACKEASIDLTTAIPQKILKECLQFIIDYTSNDPQPTLEQQKSLWVGITSVCNKETLQQEYAKQIEQLKVAFRDCFKLMLMDEKLGAGILNAAEQRTIFEFALDFSVSFTDPKYSRSIFSRVLGNLARLTYKQCNKYFDCLVLLCKVPHPRMEILISLMLPIWQQKLSQEPNPPLSLFGFLMQAVAFYYAKVRHRPSQDIFSALQKAFVFMAQHIEKFDNDRERHRVYRCAAFFFDDAEDLLPFAVGDYHVLQLNAEHPQRKFYQALQTCLAASGKYLTEEVVLRGHPFDMVYQQGDYVVAIELDGLHHNQRFHFQFSDAMNESTLNRAGIPLLRISIQHNRSEKVIAAIANAITDKDLSALPEEVIVKKPQRIAATDRTRLDISNLKWQVKVATAKTLIPSPQVAKPVTKAHFDNQVTTTAFKTQAGGGGAAPTRSAVGHSAGGGGAGPSRASVASVWGRVKPSSFQTTATTAATISKTQAPVRVSAGGGGAAPTRSAVGHSAGGGGAGPSRASVASVWGRGKPSSFTTAVTASKKDRLRLGVKHFPPLSGKGDANKPGSAPKGPGG